MKVAFDSNDLKHVSLAQKGVSSLLTMAFCIPAPISDKKPFSILLTGHTWYSAFLLKSVMKNLLFEY